MIRRTLVHQDGRRIRERSIHNIRVSRNPADVGRTPVNVLRLEVKDELCRICGLRQITACCVQDAFRLARSPRRVKDVERMLGVEMLGRAIGARLVHKIVPPMIAALLHLDLGSRSSENDHILDRRTLCDRLINNRLKPNFASSSIAAICRDDRLAAAVIYAVSYRIC